MIQFFGSGFKAQGFATNALPPSLRPPPEEGYDPKDIHSAEWGWHEHFERGSLYIYTNFRSDLNQIDLSLFDKCMDRTILQQPSVVLFQSNSCVGTEVECQSYIKYVTSKTYSGSMTSSPMSFFTLQNTNDSKFGSTTVKSLLQWQTMKLKVYPFDSHLLLAFSLE